MMLLAQFEIITTILSKYTESMGFGQLSALFGVLVLTGYIVATQNTRLALLVLLTLSLFTTADNSAIASAASLGRWFFLGLAALTALMRPAPVDGGTLGLLGAYAIINLVGMLYSESLENGLVRAIFYILAIPAFLMCFGRARNGPDDLLKFLRTISVVGVILAVVHVFFIAGGGGSGISRFKSFFTSPQTMSMATTTVTIPMIWLLLSKQAAGWFWPVAGAVLVNLLCMIASTQRTGLFSLGGAVVVMLFFFRARGALIALLVGGGFFVVALPLLGKLVDADFLADRLGSLDSTGRSEIWAAAFERAMESPVLGWGSGSASAWSERNFAKKFHQAYLQAFFDGGLVGISVFMALVIRGIWLSYRVTKAKDEKIRVIGIYTLAATLAVAAQGIVETSLADTTNETATLFYLSLGISAAALQMSRYANTSPTSTPAGRAPAVALPQPRRLPPNHYANPGGIAN
ncbi:MAG: O-antigen ligase family protein [Phycisphaerae bacterium]